MTTKKKYATNTIARSLRFLKTVLNDAVTNNKNDNLEFGTYSRAARRTLTLHI